MKYHPCEGSALPLSYAPSEPQYHSLFAKTPGKYYDYRLFPVLTTRYVNLLQITLDYLNQRERSVNGLLSGPQSLIDNSTIVLHHHSLKVGAV